MKKIKKEFLCPVCGKFRFTPLTKFDIEFGKTEADLYCHSCGWRYNSAQLEDSKSLDIDGKTIADLKKEYRKKKLKNPDYYYLTSNLKKTKHLCPCCGKHYFEDIDDLEICPICEWCNETYDENHPDEGGGINAISLNQARAEYLNKKK